MLKKTDTSENNPNGKQNNNASPVLKKPNSKEVSSYKEYIPVERLTQMRDYKELVKLLGPESSSAKRLIRTLEYEDQLSLLQIELIKMQRWVSENKKRVAILFEGRDAAGKGGAIRRFTEHLNPREIRVVALPKPNDVEKGQWYFQRYINQLPNPGEIVFFDRSWYNRAVVEPVMGFCTKKEYQRFMQQVPEFEHMLYEDGIILIKFWFSISKDEQLARFTSRMQNPLKQWKISPVDQRAQELWDDYTHYKEEMFGRTHNSFSPWILVKANSKKRARLESIRKVLTTVPYPKDKENKLRINPDPNIVYRFHRKIRSID